MSDRMNVSTQGLSLDLQPNNDFEVIERGQMDEAQFFQLLHKVNELPFDESLDNEDDCLPYIMVNGKNGNISLSKEDGKQFYCAEVDDNLSLNDAFDIAVGNIVLESGEPETGLAGKLLDWLKKAVILIVMLVVLVIVHEWSGV